jgi:hypothetical protein
MCDSVRYEVLDVNGEFHIYASDGIWSLRTEEGCIDFLGDYSEEMPEPHVIRAYFKRARKLEAFINKELGYDGLYPVKARVRLEAQVNLDAEDYLENFDNHEFLYSCDPGLDWSYDISIRNSKSGVAYLNGIWISPEYTNAEALNFIMRNLARNIIPNHVRDQDYER